MIRNERQARETRAKLERLIASLELLADPDKEPYQSLIEDLRSELQEYDSIRDGLMRIFRVESLDEIGDVLIKARIARGWTQKDLADALGVSEQMVQKDEARRFQTASLSRAADVADILGYELVGTMHPAEDSSHVDGWADIHYSIPEDVIRPFTAIHGAFRAQQPHIAIKGVSGSFESAAAGSSLPGGGRQEVGVSDTSTGAGRVEA